MKGGKKNLKTKENYSWRIRKVRLKWASSNHAQITAMVVGLIKGFCHSCMLRGETFCMSDLLLLSACSNLYTFDLKKKTFEMKHAGHLIQAVDWYCIYIRYYLIRILDHRVVALESIIQWTYHTNTYWLTCYSDHP